MLGLADLRLRLAATRLPTPGRPTKHPLARNGPSNGGSLVEAASNACPYSLATARHRRSEVQRDYIRGHGTPAHLKRTITRGARRPRPNRRVSMERCVVLAATAPFWISSSRVRSTRFTENRGAFWQISGLPHDHCSLTVGPEHAIDQPVPLPARNQAVSVGEPSHKFRGAHVIDPVIRRTDRDGGKGDARGPFVGGKIPRDDLRPHGRVAGDFEDLIFRLSRWEYPANGPQPAGRPQFG